MFRILLFASFLFSVLVSCKAKKTIASPEDYDIFLSEGILSKEMEQLEAETTFWQQRLQKDTGSYVNLLELAGNYLRLFKRTGNIELLQKGDSLLKRSSEKLNHSDPEILYSLSQTAIAQHRFRAAASYAEEAERMKGDKYTIRLLQFDACMELGQYTEAFNRLESLKDKSAFDYLIRRAKWEDHKGNLDGAIVLMEMAFEKVKDKKKNLYCWALSNMADMYGHAGRIEESYNAYLQVLEKDPANLYCLKGIAWIAYSHDNNTAEAKRILHYLINQTRMPDILLLLAQIAETEKNETGKKKLVADFIETVNQPGYGDMYNMYLIDIYAGELKNFDKAQQLAEKELQNRFTPETCDRMAWIYYQRGDLSKAFEFAKNYVHKMTFEPGATMHTGFIYAAAGKTNEARKMLEECLESSFELGPVATQQIREKLAVL